MAEFFNRDFKLQVGTLEISDRNQEGQKQPLLKCSFKLAASGAATPNKATISVHNLSKESRTKVQEKNAAVILSVGYSGFVRVIFTGQVHFGRTVRQGTDWVTKIEALDGGVAYKSARINESFDAGTGIGQVLKAAGEAMGVDVGNLQAKVDAGSVRPSLTEWTNGGVLTGKASKVLDNIAGSMGYQWSIQRGALQLLEDDETTEDELFLISPSTGLIGSPEVAISGLVTCKILLNGDIFPGRKVKIESDEIDGFYKVNQTGHSGDTWGDDWTTTVEGQPLG